MTAPRFLIADRDVTVREGCRQALATRGYPVDVAADALECVQRLRTSPPAILALDPGLLWGGGAGVLEWMRDEIPDPRIAVLLVGNGGAIPESLRDHVANRLERPHGTGELKPFVDRLESEGLRNERAWNEPLLPAAGDHS